MLHHFKESLLALLSVHQVLMLAYYCKSILELLGPVLLAHMLLELFEVACVQIYHILLGLRCIGIHIG